MDACIAGLAKMLPPGDVTVLAAAVGTTLEPASLREAPGSANETEEEAYRTVSNRLGVTHLRAREILRTVVAALPASMDESLKSRIAAHLPAPLSKLLEEPDFVEGDRAGQEEDAPGQPLRTLDEKRAHHHSVVRAANPHENTKISSGRGTGDVRAGSIATGRPTSSHPLSDGSEDEES